MNISKTLPKNSIYHNPVLLQSAVGFLQVKPGGRYVDATLGGGGHTQEILRQGGLVLGIDQDPEALSACLDFPGLIKVHSNFTHLTEIVRDHNWAPISGILFDLGVSMHQLEEAGRGFSIQKDGPLDMRMDVRLPNTAATLVNSLPVENLSQIFKDYGEIPVARSLAQKVFESKPFATTGELSKVTSKWSRQAFQALRIAVNDELGSLQRVLPEAYDLLMVGGRLVVISFHSLEDRIVKNFPGGRQITPKPVSGEKKAKLRVIEKI